MSLPVCIRALALVAGMSLMLPLPGMSQESVDLSIPRIGALPVPTQMHGTAVVGQRLYIFGGERPDGWSNTVISAPIASDGKLGQWRSENLLPVRLASLSNCIEVLGNRIYLIGGVTAAEANTEETSTERSQDVFWTEAGPDGTLRPWKKSPPFPGPHLGFMATSSTDRHLLVTGGSTKKGVFGSIYVADFAADGEPVNWRVAGTLPVTLWHHGAAVQGERLYVWGGLISRKNASQVSLTPAEVNSRVWSAPLKSNGTIGDWREETPMPAATFAAACSGFNDFLVSIGGRYHDKNPTNGIWYARLENGRVGKWTFVRTDLEARVYHSLGLDQNQGRIFVAGGQKKIAPGRQPVARMDAVQAFQIPQPENSRLSVAQVSADGAKAAVTGADPQKGFATLREALQKAAGERRPVLAFFYSPQVPDCRRFWDSVIETPAFRALKSSYILSAVDISGNESSLGPQYNIYKVPALALIAPDGTRMKSTISLQTMDDVTGFVGR